MTLSERAEKIAKHWHCIDDNADFREAIVKEIESELKAAVQEALSDFIDTLVLLEIDNPITKKFQNEAYEKAAQVANDHARIKGPHIHKGFAFCVTQVASEIRTLKESK